jgi:hypothetical protein
MSIHQSEVPSRNRIASLGALLAASGMLLLPVHGIAQNIEMKDGGSMAIINPGNGTGLLGMNSWVVDKWEENQLKQQSFWYSIDEGVAQSLYTMSLAGTPQTQNGADGIYDVLMTFTNLQLRVSIEYTLTGDGTGSGSADMQEQITIKNISSSQLTLNFFQYSDFNLLGGANDTATLLGTPYIPGNPLTGYLGAVQTTGAGGSGIAELINAPNATYGEVNYADVGVNATLYKLNNTTNLTLNGTANAGQGDVTWALQWTKTLNPGQMLDISKDKGLSIELIPEPSTVALSALGIGMLGLVLRRRLS